MSILGIIFSCNRAMQLDATLRSFFLHCLDAEKIEFRVIYKATTLTHKQQYQQLTNEFKTKEVVFIEEQDFRYDLIKIVKGELSSFSILRLGFKMLLSFLGIKFTIQTEDTSSFLMFLVDDNIFVKNFRAEDITSTLTKYTDALGFSLRLGSNIKISYTNNKNQTIPDYTVIQQDILKFKWVSSSNDFGYPLEVSSSLYRKFDILPLLIFFKFRNPNTLEDVLSGKTRFFKRVQPYLLCYFHSVTFCNPLNLVQQTVSNRAGNRMEYSAQSLQQMFKQGNRINVKKYSDFTPVSCHQEVELLLSTSDE